MTTRLLTNRPQAIALAETQKWCGEIVKFRGKCDRVVEARNETSGLGYVWFMSDSCPLRKIVVTSIELIADLTEAVHNLPKERFGILGQAILQRNLFK